MLITPPSFPHNCSPALVVHLYLALGICCAAALLLCPLATPIGHVRGSPGAVPSRRSTGPGDRWAAKTRLRPSPTIHAPHLPAGRTWARDGRAAGLGGARGLRTWQAQREDVGARSRVGEYLTVYRHTPARGRTSMNASLLTSPSWCVTAKSAAAAGGSSSGARRRKVRGAALGAGPFFCSSEHLERTGFVLALALHRALGRSGE